MNAAELNAAVAPGIKILQPTSPKGYDDVSSIATANGMPRMTVVISQNAKFRTNKFDVVRRCSNFKRIVIRRELLPTLAMQIST